MLLFNPIAWIKRLIFEKEVVNLWRKKVSEVVTDQEKTSCYIVNPHFVRVRLFTREEDTERWRGGAVSFNELSLSLVNAWVLVTSEVTDFCSQDLKGYLLKPLPYLYFKQAVKLCWCGWVCMHASTIMALKRDGRVACQWLHLHCKCFCTTAPRRSTSRSIRLLLLGH